MTLSQTAIITKQIITFSIIFLVLGIVSFIGYKIWYAYYLAHLPVKEPIPDTKFGVLPQPDFPQSFVSSSNYTYTIDTTTGNLPKLGADEGFDKLTKVYFITQVYATFLSSEKSQKLATKFNINSDPQILSETHYLYKQENKTLNIDLNTGNFIYTNEATSSAQEALDNDEKLVTDFKNFLSSLAILKEELTKGQTRVIKDSRAQTAQISLWPEAIDKKPLLTSDFNKSLVSAVVKKTASNLDDYLSLNFTFWPIDLTTFATYPTKLPEKAFEDLRSGKGIVVVEPPKAQVSIIKIYLAYFLPDNYNPYLQPIYVFEGPQFIAYVSAISEQFQNQTK